MPRRALRPGRRARRPPPPQPGLSAADMHAQSLLSTDPSPSRGRAHARARAHRALPPPPLADRIPERFVPPNGRMSESSSRKRPRTAGSVTAAPTTSKYFGAGTSSYFKTAAPRKGSLPAMLGGQPHTLICGTQASDNALDGDIPFFTNENAFWHIMGDALGFRRGFHMRRSEAVDSIRPHLLHEELSLIHI